MKDFTELLMRIIAQEIKYVETMRHSLKEDELTILRLQNKSRGLEKEIEERKLLIEEYRVCLRRVSEENKAKMKLVPPAKKQVDTSVSINNTIEIVPGLEKQA